MKILRRFRYYFLEENKFRKYSLYAVGEVILIVIGILIALQLNNLNEDKIDRKREQIYLEEYLNDLEVCKADLQRTIYRTAEAYKHTDSLLQVIYEGRMDIDLARVSNLLLLTHRWSTFEGSDGTVSEILNGGNLHLIRNPTIRSSVASWYANLKDMQSWEVVLREYVEEYYSILIDHLHIKKSVLPDLYILDLHPELQFTNFTNAINQSKWLELNNQLRFKNIVADIRWRQIHLNGIYKIKEREIDSLMSTIKQELTVFY